MFNVKDMMQQAQNMQAKMAEIQEKFKDIFVGGESGGGMVKVTMACNGEVKSVDIDPGVIVADEKETLEDLIVAAINNAALAKDERVQAETQAMMEAMGLPAGVQLPF